MILAYLLDNCYYSQEAFHLLKNNHIPFQYIQVPQDEKIKSKFKKKNKMNTFPQLFLNTNKIGGYDDLIKYFEIIDQIKVKKLNKDVLLYMLQK